MFGMGWQELALVFVIVLIIFGPKSLPKIGQALGRGIREFKDATMGLTSALNDEDDEKPAKPAPAPPQVQQGPTVAASAEQSSAEHHV